MNKFLAIQTTYEGIDIALFNESEIVEHVVEDKKRASKNIIKLIDKLLKNNDCDVKDLAFVAANQGPGPFTTLRVVIASVNGLGFAAKKTLIGIDGLDALLEQYCDDRYAVAVGLLDAFGKDVYFSVQQVDQPERKKGYKNISVFLSQLKAFLPKVKIQFMGNGSYLYKNEIRDTFQDEAVFTPAIAMHSSIEQIGIMALEKWKHSSGLVDQIFPLYLKEAAFKKSISPSSF